ncbi:phage tail protein [Lysinibacillus sp. UGB7]|uniref:phage tail protein n=1 Tax=Lysinibacillus sp. UGB7 TaxID=3411039 RepID=UPI003B81DC0E
MIELNLRQVEYVQEIFRNTPQQVPKVVSRAINRSAHAARAQANRSVREHYNIKQRDVSSTIKVRTASPDNLTASIRSSGEPLKLMTFRVSPNGPKKVKQVTVGVKKGSRKRIKGAFVTGMNSGHVNVFTRVTKKRLPIRGHYGPSVPQMIGNESVVSVVENKAYDVLDKRLEHEINRLLRG